MPQLRRSAPLLQRTGWSRVRGSPSSTPIIISGAGSICLASSGRPFTHLVPYDAIKPDCPIDEYLQDVAGTGVAKSIIICRRTGRRTGRCPKVAWIQSVADTTPSALLTSSTRALLTCCRSGPPLPDARRDGGARVWEDCEAPRAKALALVPSNLRACPHVAGR
jgi:hypothetical protein